MYLLVKVRTPLFVLSPQGSHTRETHIKWFCLWEKAKCTVHFCRKRKAQKSLQNRKMRLKLAASLMCLCFLNFSILPRDRFLDWYPILIHMVDILVPNSGSKLSVQWHSWQSRFLNIFPDPLCCVMFGSVLGFQGECIFKNIAIFLINGSQQMSVTFRSKLMC